MLGVGKKHYVGKMPEFIAYEDLDDINTPSEIKRVVDEFDAQCLIIEFDDAHFAKAEDIGREDFFDPIGFERGQLYYIHCFNDYLDYDCSKLYRYSGLDYSSILHENETYDAPISVFRVELDNEPTIKFDGEPTVERYNDIIIPRRKIERLLVEDKAIPIFTFDADDELQTILCLYRRELNDERIQICLKAAVYRNGHEIISMPFIHLYAPQHSHSHQS